jgi:hypothetical protein
MQANKQTKVPVHPYQPHLWLAYLVVRLSETWVRRMVDLRPQGRPRRQFRCRQPLRWTRRRVTVQWGRRQQGRLENII